MSPDAVIKFWFEELTYEQWFTKSDKTDELIRIRFGELHKSAAQAELYSWRASTLGRLAEIIVLDQFSRNLYRNSPKAFETDPMSLTLAQELVAQKFDIELPIEKRAFAYMPYMHSESKIIHQEAVKLFSLKGLEQNLDFEIQHKVIIDRFGRYPHRNKILGRDSTSEELEFLKTHVGF